jgi:methylmalonyl-CoA/ethylmalonyl-CoA epimerase
LNFNIHHVGVAVQNIEETAKSYVRYFGYQRNSEIIHDPQQGAYVQFLSLPGDRVYLELVQPDGPDSNLSKAIEKGGGLNHVCYATDDIETACEALRERGLFLIASPVPAVAFKGRRIAWLMSPDRVITELVESSEEETF